MPQTTQRFLVLIFSVFALVGVASGLYFFVDGGFRFGELDLPAVKLNFTCDRELLAANGVDVHKLPSFQATVARHAGLVAAADLYIGDEAGDDLLEPEKEAWFNVQLKLKNGCTLKSRKCFASWKNLDASMARVVQRSMEAYFRLKEQSGTNMASNVIVNL